MDLVVCESAILPMLETGGGGNLAMLASVMLSMSCKTLNWSNGMSWSQNQSFGQCQGAVSLPLIIRGRSVNFSDAI